jgi:isoleucyl-tRNA synthetase
VQVGDELLVIAEKLVESVAKACSLPAYKVVGVKKAIRGI